MRSFLGNAAALIDGKPEFSGSFASWIAHWTVKRRRNSQKYTLYVQATAALYRTLRFQAPCISKQHWLNNYCIKKTTIFCPHYDSKVTLMRQSLAHTDRFVVPVSRYLLNKMNNLRTIWRLNLWSTMTSRSCQSRTQLNIFKKRLNNCSLNLFIKYLVQCPSIWTQSQKRDQITPQVIYLPNIEKCGTCCKDELTRVADKYQ